MEADPAPPTAESGVDALLLYLTTLFDRNTGLVDDITTRSAGTVKRYAYHAPPVTQGESTCTFSLNTSAHHVTVGSVVDAWRTSSVTLEDIYDLFNLKIEYSCKSYDDIRRLNAGMNDAVQRCARVFESTSLKGAVELHKFVHNAQAIRAALLTVHGLTFDAVDESAQLSDGLQVANVALSASAGRGVRFTSQSSAPHPVAALLHPAPLGGAAVQVLSQWVGQASDSWVLKYQASKHGFKGADFHRHCDTIPRLLMLVQSDNGSVFGAYMPGMTFDSCASRPAAAAPPFLFGPPVGGKGGSAAPPFAAAPPLSSAFSLAAAPPPTFAAGAVVVSPEDHWKTDKTAFLFSLLNTGVPASSLTRFNSRGIPLGAMAAKTVVPFADVPPKILDKAGAFPSFRDTLVLCDSPDACAQSSTGVGGGFLVPTCEAFTGAQAGWTVKEILVFTVPA